MEDEDLLTQNAGALAQPEAETNTPPDPQAEAEYRAKIKQQEAEAAKLPVLRKELSAADVDAKIGGGGGAPSRISDAAIDRITGAPLPGTPESMRGLFQPHSTISGKIGSGLAQSAAETAVGAGQRADEALNYFYGPDQVRRSFRRGPSGTFGDIKVTRSPPVRDIPSYLSPLDQLARSTRKGTWLDALAKRQSEGPISSVSNFVGDLGQIAAASALTRSPIVGGGLYGVTRPADTLGDVAINTIAGAAIPGGLKALGRMYPALGTPAQVRAAITEIGSKAADLAGKISGRFPIPRNSATSTMVSAIRRIEALVPSGEQTDALNKITGRITSAIKRGPTIGAEQMKGLMEDVSRAESDAVQNGHRELAEGIGDLREKLQSLVSNSGSAAEKAQFGALNAARDKAVAEHARSVAREAQQASRGPLGFPWYHHPVAAAGHIGSQIATRAAPATYRAFTRHALPGLLGAEGAIRGLEGAERLKEGANAEE
jgi:hypothetical protein